MFKEKEMDTLIRYFIPTGLTTCMSKRYTLDLFLKIDVCQAGRQGGGLAGLRCEKLQR